MKFYQIIKRCFDLIVALGGLIFLLPVILIVCIAVAMDSPGKIVFKQERVGKNGKIFELLKFRTMKEGSENLKISVQEIKKIERSGNDYRVTKVGNFLRKFALDEIPQLINILKGDMSFVGPRPHFLARFKDSKMLERKLVIKPGLISLAVAHGGIYLSDEETLRYDLEYIKKQSFLLDLKIIVKTIILYSKRLYER